MVRAGKFVTDADECCCEGYLPPLDDCPDDAHCLAFFEDTYYISDVQSESCNWGYLGSLDKDCSGSYTLGRWSACTWQSGPCTPDYYGDCIAVLRCGDAASGWQLAVRVCWPFMECCQWSKPLGNGPAGNYTLRGGYPSNFCSATVTVYS